MATSEAFKQGDTHDDTTTTLARQHDARTCPRLHTRTSYSSLHHSTSDLTDKKQRITKHLAELTRHAQPLITLIEKPDVLQSLKHDRAANLAMMVKEHGFDAVKDYGVLAGYGRALFDCGQYAKAAEVLTHVGALVCQCVRACVCARVVCLVITFIFIPHARGMLVISLNPYLYTVHLPRRHAFRVLGQACRGDSLPQLGIRFGRFVASA